MEDGMNYAIFNTIHKVVFQEKELLSSYSKT